MTLTQSTRFYHLALFSLAALFAAGQAAAQESPGANEQRKAWWREARFGMFVHWGVYSVLGGERAGKKIDETSDWIMWNDKIPLREYARYASGLTGEKFVADDFAKLAEDAGMKYLVVTAKHRDGFAMFPSKATTYDISEMTPFKRDPLKELSEACSKRGIKFCVSYSLGADWAERDARGNTWDFGPDDKRDLTSYLQRKALPQVGELLSNYGPLGIFWFDASRGVSKEQAQQLADLVQLIQPDCLLNNRLGPGVSGDFSSTRENSPPRGAKEGDWVTLASINSSWGFKKADNDWKPPSEIVSDLVDIVSKGGNYLMNVAPDARGAIPQASTDCLREVGRWLKANGEAVYGASKTAFGNEFGGREEADGKGKSKFIPNRSWRCTTKPGKLFIHLFDWPESGNLELAVGGAHIEKCYLLADPEQKNLAVSKSATGASIALPKESTDKIASVVCLEFDPAATFEPPPETSQPAQPDQPTEPAEHMDLPPSGSGRSTYFGTPIP